MKVLIIIIVLAGIISASCSSNSQSNQEKNNDSIASSQSKLIPVRDTSIEYSIEGISAEGASAMAKYTNGKIVECEIGIFGETGQTKILYTFQNGRVNVLERQYNYKAVITSVKSDKDMELKKEISYEADVNGIPIGKVDSNRTDIFNEFKKVVPFDLHPS